MKDQELARYQRNNLWKKSAQGAKEKKKKTGGWCTLTKRPRDIKKKGDQKKHKRWRRERSAHKKIKGKKQTKEKKLRQARGGGRET